MGCNYSTENISLDKRSKARTGKPKRQETATHTLTSINCNEAEIDISHFSNCQEAIGIGGFGLVRKVTKISGTDKGVQYAMKSMSKEAILKRTSGPNAVITELKCLEKLTNSIYVSRIHYAFQTPSHLYMVLDLATGGDLRLCLRSLAIGKLSEDAARHVIVQTLLALSHCHQKSILHRDIKPENLLMTSGGIVQLSDFGVAKILPDICDCRSTSGTHGYMAPEVYMNTHMHGPSAEWFSVGVTLHELLTGRRPFEASRLQAFRYVTALPANYNYSVHQQLPDLNNEVDAVKVHRVSREQRYRQRPLDSLWPEYLHSPHCNYLSEDVKSFIRALLIPDVAARLGGPNTCQTNTNCKNSSPYCSSDSNSSANIALHGMFGLDAIQKHRWLRGVDWISLEATRPVLSSSSALVREFPTAFQQKHEAPHHHHSTILGYAARLTTLPHCTPLPSLSVNYSATSSGREELQQALQAHMQAPAISHAQQEIFKNYEYRTQFSDRPSSINDRRTQEYSEVSLSADKPANENKFKRVERTRGPHGNCSSGSIGSSDRGSSRGDRSNMQHRKKGSTVKPLRRYKKEEWKDAEAYDYTNDEPAHSAHKHNRHRRRDPFGVFSP